MNQVNCGRLQTYRTKNDQTGAPTYLQSSLTSPHHAIPPVTIVISDISGYTEFVSKAEIEHGAKILKHLLETIVEAAGDGTLAFRLFNYSHQSAE